MIHSLSLSHSHPQFYSLSHSNSRSNSHWRLQAAAALSTFLLFPTLPCTAPTCFQLSSFHGRRHIHTYSSTNTLLSLQHRQKKQRQPPQTSPSRRRRRSFTILAMSVGPLPANFTSQRRNLSLDDLAVQQQLAVWGLNKIQVQSMFPSFEIINLSPPVFYIPHFLSDSECDQLIEYIRVRRQRENNDDLECDQYLNYRVNQETKQGGLSSEADQLIKEQNLEQNELDSTASSGFRVQVEPYIVQPFVPRLLALLNTGQDRIKFFEGTWVKPNKKELIFRDQTIVQYQRGEGVPPHVDGKDATLLMYLTNAHDDMGGATVFPEDGFKVPPVKGAALLYNSKRDLLHYSQKLAYGEKWIMQFLLDFKFDPNIPFIDYETGQVY